MWCNITNYSECLVYVYSQSLCLYPDNDDNSNHPIKLKFVKPLLCARSCARDWSLSSVQSLSHVRLFATPRTAAHQASLSITNSRSLFKLMSIELCHPTFSFSVLPFSSCPQSFPASGSFPVSHFFTSGGQSIGVSASAWVLPMNISFMIDWSHLLTGLPISLLTPW